MKPFLSFVIITSLAVVSCRDEKNSPISTDLNKSISTLPQNFDKAWVMQSNLDG